MNIVDIKTVITSWELTGDGYEAPIVEGEKLGYVIGRYMGTKLRNCVISGDIHISATNTTFVLDIKIESLITYETENTPTPEEVYELYRNAKAKWRYEILKKGESCGFINPMIIIEIRFVPFENQKSDIEKAIRQSLVQDN